MNFGLIGCGAIARWHADAIGMTEGAVLAGVADARQEAAKAFAETYNIRAYDSVEDLLSSPDIDAVCICTPSGLHAPLAIQAAEHGKHMVIEKPMALSTASADEVIAACEKNHVTAAIVSQLRFSPDIQHVRELVQSGELGQVISVGLEMKYFRSDEYYAASNWRGTWKMDGGGALMNQGIHGIDVMSFIMGGVKAVSGQIKTLVKKIEVEDTAVAAVEFSNGALGTVVASVATAPGYSRTLTISTTKGTIVLEEENIKSCDIEGLSLPNQVKERRNFGSSNPTDIPVEGHMRQIKDFIAAVNEGRDPFVSLTEGRKAIEIIESIYTSSRIGARVVLGEK